MRRPSRAGSSKLGQPLKKSPSAERLVDFPRRMRLSHGAVGSPQLAAPRPDTGVGPARATSAKGIGHRRLGRVSSPRPRATLLSPASPGRHQQRPSHCFPPLPAPGIAGALPAGLGPSQRPPRQTHHAIRRPPSSSAYFLLAGLRPGTQSRRVRLELSENEPPREPTDIRNCGIGCPGPPPHPGAAAKPVAASFLPPAQPTFLRLT